MLRTQRLVEAKILGKFFMKESRVYLDPDKWKLKEDRKVFFRLGVWDGMSENQRKWTMRHQQVRKRIPQQRWYSLGTSKCQAVLKRTLHAVGCLHHRDECTPNYAVEENEAWTERIIYLRKCRRGTPLLLGEGGQDAGVQSPPTPPTHNGCLT